MKGRRGFALLTVLCLLTLCSALALSAATGGREGVDSARNRISAERAAWAASGCGARALASLGESLSMSGDAELERQWRSLPAALDAASARWPATCEMTMESRGSRLDVRTAGIEQFETLFRAAGWPHEAHRMASALARWDGASEEELTLLPEFERHPEAVRLVGVGTERVDLSQAPLPVIAAVPGFSENAAALVGRWRTGDRPLRDLRDLAAHLPAEDARHLVANLSKADRAVSFTTRHWVLRATASDGSPAISRTEELVIGREGHRLVAHARRVW